MCYIRTLYGIGFAGFLGSYLIASLAVDALATGGKTGWRGTAQAFAPTLVPIAAAYEAAHNYPFVLQSAGQFLTIARDLLVGADTSVSLLEWLSVLAFGGSQIGLIIGGHVIAVVAARRVAIGRYETRSLARRGHFPLVVVMVGYTVLSLWIVSRPLVA